MSGIRSFMGWTHVPDVDSSNPSDDNPFAGPKAPVPNKVSVQMPTEEWLCKKLSKLNLTDRGISFQDCGSCHLPMDQFLKPARSQNKWYGLYPGQQSNTASNWNKLNSSFGKQAWHLLLQPHAGYPKIPYVSGRKSTREASVICNQAASFNRCLFKVQQEMQSQLKTIRGESKGKVSKKISEASDNL